VVGEQVIELTDMDVQNFRIFRSTIRVVCPHQAAQLFCRNIWMALHDFENPLLDWW